MILKYPIQFDSTMQYVFEFLITEDVLISLFFICETKLDSKLAKSYYCIADVCYTGLYVFKF